MRILLAIFGEICVFAFFAVLAWTGWIVLQVLAGDTLVSLPNVPIQIPQSVIPIGAALFMIAEALSVPTYLERVRLGRSGAHEEAQDAVAAAQAQLKSGEGLQ